MNDGRGGHLSFDVARGGGGGELKILKEDPWKNTVPFLPKNKKWTLPYSSG